MKYFIFIIFMILWVALGISFPRIHDLLGSFFAGIVFADISNFVVKKGYFNE